VGKLRYTVMIDRRMEDVVIALAELQAQLESNQGIYSFEEVSGKTRITFVSTQPIRSLYSLEDPAADPLHRQVESLSTLKQMLETA
jgi:hypothetical protein